MPNDEQLEALELADQKDQIAYTRQLCERYLQNHPDHVPTLVTYARNLISLAQYSLAKAALDHAQKIVSKKRLPLVLVQRGHLLEAQGAFSEAEAMYMEAHVLDPVDATYLIYAGSIIPSGCH